MGKKIVVFSDGTGNAANSPDKTNVWRLYQALDLGTDDQIAMFDDGVGTSSFSPARYLGLVFGFGLKRNVLDLYKFVCRNYEKNDQIFAFGFSRGGFTVRVLNGLINKQGLIPFVSEEHLDHHARSAYRVYRAKGFRPNWFQWLWVTLIRGARDGDRKSVV